MHNKHHQPLHCLQGKRWAGSLRTGTCPCSWPSKVPSNPNHVMTIGRVFWPFISPLSFQSCDSILTGWYKLHEVWCKTLLCKLLWLPLEEPGKQMRDQSYCSYVPWGAWVWMMSQPFQSFYQPAVGRPAWRWVSFSRAVAANWYLGASRACVAVGKLGRHFLAPAAVQAQICHFFCIQCL